MIGEGWRVSGYISKTIEKRWDCGESSSLEKFFFFFWCGAVNPQFKSSQPFIYWSLALNTLTKDSCPSPVRSFIFPTIFGRYYHPLSWLTGFFPPFLRTTTLINPSTYNPRNYYAVVVFPWGSWGSFPGGGVWVNKTKTKTKTKTTNKTKCPPPLPTPPPTTPLV